MDIIFCCLPRLRGFRKHRPPPPSPDHFSEKSVQNLPSPDNTYQPYLPMSPNGTHYIYLQADGVRNERKLVEAYLDKTLERSVISDHKARETNAKVTQIPDPVRLHDDRGRQYLCDSSITVTWYLQGKEKVTPPPETFYIFEETDGDIPIRLRGDIEPSLQLAAAQDDVNDLHVQQNEKETKKGKNDQAIYAAAQEAKRQQEQKKREAELLLKYKAQGKKK